MLFDRRLLNSFDFYLLTLILLVPIFSLFVLYSAGYDKDYTMDALNWLGLEIHSRSFVKQGVFVLGGLIIIGFSLLVTPSTLSRIAFLALGTCVVLLVAVDVLGFVAKGSQRWIGLGGLRFQPSEPSKLAVTLAVARYISVRIPRGRGLSFFELIIPGLLIGVPGILTILQPDLGSGIMVMAGGASILFFVGIKLRTLMIVGLTAVLALYPAWLSLHDYQKRRVMVLFNPEVDPAGSGYHINQSKIAVGSGAFLGKGYMQGTQTQLEFLPEHTTDFIFSVLGEELGFVGCISLIVLYLLLFHRMLKAVARARDLFSALVIFGITASLALQAMINVGMVLGLLPVVGVPLPLFSYGGSSLMSTMFSLGIVLSLDMRRMLVPR